MTPDLSALVHHVSCHSTECATEDRAVAVSERYVHRWKAGNLQWEAEVSKCNPLSRSLRLKRLSD